MTSMADMHLPPQDLVAEQSVLGSCLLHADSLDEAAIMLTTEHFYSEKHQIVWLTLVEMREQGKPFDAVTVSEWLDKKNLLADAGGVPYILELIGAVPHAAHVKYYAEIVLDHSRRRAALNAATNIQRSIRDKSVPTDEVLENAENEIHRAIEHGIIQVDTSIESALMAALDGLGKHRSGGLEVQIPSVDMILGGLEPGNMTIIGARPSVGKTAFMMTTLRRLGEMGVPTALFSYEMTREQIAERTLAAATGISLYHLKRGELTASQKQDLVHQANIASKLPIIIDDSDKPLPQLLATMRTAVRRYGLKLIAIDYLQKVPSGGNHKIREQEIAWMSRELKRAAKALKVVVVVLSQLNRSVDLRDNQRPKLSDLRESGAIEQDADQVLFLWRPNKDMQGVNGNENAIDDHGFLTIAKNRQGQLGEAKLYWNGPTMTYREWTHSSHSDESDRSIDNWRQ